MPDHSTPDHTTAERAISRRSLFRYGAVAAGAIGAGSLLAACGGSGGAGAAAGPDARADLVLSSWQIPVDIETYRKFAADYKATHPNVTITVQETPGGDFNQWFTTQLAGGSAPDIIRITWQQIGRYAQNNGVVALDDYLAPGFGDDFAPTFWSAAQLDGRVHGIPQHTDTFATFYRTDVFSKIGVTPPTGLDQAWTLEQFMDIAREVKKATGAYALSYGFGGVPTGYRWLPFLYMHGGRLVADDGVTPAIDSPEGVDALTWFQRLYTEGLISMSNTVKGSNDAATVNSFITGQAGMMIFGDWIMSDVGKGLPQEAWGVTYMPRGRSAASDLGGNLLAVSATCKNPAVAADFIQFVCNEQNMRYFCENDLFLPVRTSLTREPLAYKAQQKQMALFTEQATTVPQSMAKVQTSPKFNAMNQVLADELDLCWTGQKTPADTARSIADGIRNATA
jgi:multiple sugar transport system substrate-binding protein